MHRAILLLGIVVVVTVVPDRSTEAKRVGKDRTNVCTTEEAQAIIERPEFKSEYTYCTTGNRAIGSSAVIACIENQSGLSAECASCYSWYKACILRSCFNACHRPKPQVYCTICARTACQGQFYQCSGTTKPFPGSKISVGR